MPNVMESFNCVCGAHMHSSRFAQKVKGKWYFVQQSTLNLD